MTIYRVTLDAYNSRPPLAGSYAHPDMPPRAPGTEWRARVRLYVQGWSPTDALHGVGTIYARHSDGVVTLNGGLGHDRTAVSLPEWEIVTSPRKVATYPKDIPRQLSTGGTVRGMIV